MTRKLMTLGLVGTACLALAGCGAPEEPATSQETAAHMSPAPAPQDSNDSAGAVSAMNSPHHIHDKWPKACMSAGARGSCERFQA